MVAKVSGHGVPYNVRMNATQALAIQSASVASTVGLLRAFSTKTTTIKG